MSLTSSMGLLGAIIVVIAFIFLGHEIDSYRFFEELPDSAFKKMFFLGYFLFGLSMSFQPLYYKSLRKRVSKSFILVSLGCVIPFFVLVWSVGKSGNYLDRAFFVYIFIVCLLSWMLVEVANSNKQLPTIWFNLIRSTILVFIGIFVIWLAIILVTNRQGYIFGFTLLDISQFDISSRVLRGNLFIFLQLLILMHWIENFSYNAIQLKTRDKQVQGLLLEKDLLIEKLANSSTLIESGALSAGLAHELNQYLARIELNSDEALQLIGQESVKPEDLKQPLGNILKANHLAAKLILSLKKLFNRGEESPSLCSIDDLIREIVSLYSGRIQKSHIQIEFDLQVIDRQSIWESLFRQVVVNLLSNAIDALDTSSQNNKVIQIHSRINEQGYYCLAITDNGPGIHGQQEAKLFNLFATSKSTGTGVGLWLSRYIVERHQGSLIYKNLPDNGGVSFIVTIPPGLKPKWGS
ncbi:sensor histidine kinase [Polynucleobacter sp. AP-Kaivos-20-H2]|uniref:sensor histidine kinase n=1 Tax=Polynucleobacter sp. AP-Kaivos-20-H2 TaxID=2689104 RepID=UPI001C0AD914|nr:HAMP domain-containing sensor histidine kinase [Polynucleobacter sp. AP-Kaivos-20-H2]